MSSSSAPIDLAGIFPPIATPFDERGSVRPSALERNLEFLNLYDLKGVVVLGSNGEFVLLTREEKLITIETVRDLLPPGRLLIAGTGCEATQETVELSRSAARAGADAALVITPHYYKNRMDREALIRHFTTVADDSPIPIILYNMPASTGLDLDSPTVTELARHGNIMGIKDSSGNLNKMAQILGTVKGDFQILAGSAGFLLPALSLGAVGGVVALANVAPGLCIDLYQAFLRGELDRAVDLQVRIVGLNNLVTREGGVPALKAALDLVGLVGGPPRPPLQPAGTEMRERLRRSLSELDLLGEGTN
ncbi:MAG: dihydrodipicolinate synthase family protein [Spirochaetaceae bacterium]|nr:MAG: dihydrodipicolinate synthase family protein [Spirochaetaceae bacterium]